MKRIERRRLKRNEFIEGFETTVAYLRDNRDQLTVTGLVVAILALGVGGYFFWQRRVNDRASEMFGEAMAITEAQIAPPSTLPGAVQAPGTYPNEDVKMRAAVTAFQAVAKTYPSTRSGIAAEYQAASALLALNQLPEAEQGFEAVIAQAPSSMYAPLSKLGLASTYAAEKQYDKAIQAFNDLAAQRDGALPVDGILMQLAETYVHAGRLQDARVAFKRVVDEFPDSSYVAEAKTELAQISAP